MTEIVAEISQLARRRRTSTSAPACRRVSRSRTTRRWSRKRDATRASPSGERDVVPRVSDSTLLTSSTSGKIEIETLEDGREGQVLERIMKAAILEVFRRAGSAPRSSARSSGRSKTVRSCTRAKTSRRPTTAAARAARRRRAGALPPRGRRIAGRDRLRHRVRPRGPAPHQAAEQGRRRHPRHLPRPRLTLASLRTSPSLFPVHFISTHRFGRERAHERGGEARCSRERQRSTARSAATRHARVASQNARSTRGSANERWELSAAGRISLSAAYRSTTRQRLLATTLWAGEGCAISHLAAGSAPPARRRTETDGDRRVGPARDRSRATKVMGVGSFIVTADRSDPSRRSVDGIRCTSATRRSSTWRRLDGESLEASFESARRWGSPLLAPRESGRGDWRPRSAGERARAALSRCPGNIGRSSRGSK